MIEMLVVLALFGLVAGAVVLAFPSERRVTGAEAQALAFAADLERAMDLAVLRQRAFGVRRDQEILRFVERNDDGLWVVHPEKTLNPVKLSGTSARSSLQKGATFVVSHTLVPGSSDALRIAFGSAATITFDGATIRLNEGTDATDTRKWLQPD